MLNKDYLSPLTNGGGLLPETDARIWAESRTRPRLASHLSHSFCVFSVLASVVLHTPLDFPC
jgi:hypothetical protein